MREGEAEKRLRVKGKLLENDTRDRDHMTAWVQWLRLLMKCGKSGLMWLCEDRGFPDSDESRLTCSTVQQDLSNHASLSAGHHPVKKTSHSRSQWELCFLQCVTVRQVEIWFDFIEHVNSILGYV